VTTQVRTETAFDGSHWEATCPDGWTFRREMSLKGWPYVFETHPSVRLVINWGRDPRVNFGEGLTRAGIQSESVRLAYVETLMQARLREFNSLPKMLWRMFRPLRSFDREVTRRDAGEFAGFTHPKADGWAGFFSSEPWMFYVVLTAHPTLLERATQEALGIISSLRIKRA